MYYSRFVAWFSSLVVLLLSTSSHAFVVVDLMPQALQRGATRPQRWSTALSAERRPWDILRFVQQSSRFVQNPLVPSTTPRRKIIAPGQTIWKAGGRDTNEFTFAPLDDVVMGGASSSTFDSTTGKWTGDVTDANNGGFIGIRSTPFVNCLNVKGFN